MTDTLPVLYILVRNDLASMNPGKIGAQCSHASNAFIHKLWNSSSNYDASIQNAASHWTNSTGQGFGTVLVLQAPIQTIQGIVYEFSNNITPYVADIIHDPTYPIVDGQVVHHIPLDTCGYVFIPDKNTDKRAKTLLGDLPLYR